MEFSASGCPPQSIKPGFTGSVIRMVDGSTWKIGPPLSKLKYEQNNAPFEARQVFSCVCIDDPSGKHHEGQEAVVKVHYQVIGDEDIIDYYEKAVERCAQTAKKDPLSAIRLEDLDYARQALHSATHPSPVPNKASLKEVEALRLLGEAKNCAYTPQLLTYAGYNVKEDIDSQGIVDGYMLFMLMTKVPGQPISSDYYWALPISKREEIRQAFKTALICLVTPYISSRQRIAQPIWDDEARKCYIVDFEDYSVLKPNKMIKWSDEFYEFWGLVESCQPKTRLGNFQLSR